MDKLNWTNVLLVMVFIFLIRHLSTMGVFSYPGDRVEKKIVVNQLRAHLIFLGIMIFITGLSLNTKTRLADGYKRKAELLEQVNARMDARVKALLEELKNDQQSTYDSLVIESDRQYNLIQYLKKTQ